MIIRIEKGISGVHASVLSEWSNQKGREFQEQWMGPKVTYPLSSKSVQALENLFSIFHDDEFVGVIQEIVIANDNVHIGRFLINPNRSGQGLGKAALETFIKFIFEDAIINSISLTVDDSNTSAKKLYENLGFEIDKIIEDPRLKYILKKYR